MGTSSGSNMHHKPSSSMLPPPQQSRHGGLPASLSLLSSDARMATDQILIKFVNLPLKVPAQEKRGPLML